VKKVLFLLFTCLLLVAMVLPACQGGEKPPTGDVIKVGVIGPMQYLQGRHNWIGAEMARDEINAAGGIKVGDKTYQIQLIQADSNEINSITDATAAMEKLITVDKADFVMGGFRTEAVTPMIEVACDNHEVFLGCGSATLSLNTPVGLDYDRYKYWFRVTPFASTYLVDNMMMELAMAGAIIKEETGIARPLRVAVCSEGAQWADSMTQIIKNFVPAKLKMEVSGVWRPSPTATELTAEMTAMEAANTDIIASVISGPLGIPYGRSLGELKVASASVGINVESQAVPGYMENTNGLGMYDTSLSSFAKGIVETPLTVPFFNEFLQRAGEAPAYNAGTYDAMYILKAALERAGTLDSDAVVPELEKTDMVGTVAPRFMFTGMDAPLHNPHDVTYGPGFSTGIATQWQPDANGEGQCVAVWPNPDYASAYVAAGYSPDWGEVNYGGMAKWQICPPLKDKLDAEAAAQPGGPVAPTAPTTTTTPTETTTPTAPAGGEVSFPAATYTNDTYGFSVQYPKDWVERPELVTTPYHLAAFGVSGFVPGIVLYAYDADAPETADWIVNSFVLTGNQDPKVKSDITEETLADGTKAYTYKAYYISSTGYEITSYCLDADRGDKRIRVNVFTIDAFDPYNETLYSEIAHTLTFK
jgi:branched-chain amino acid transport system substrate-binding protein